VYWGYPFRLPSELHFGSGPSPTRGIRPVPDPMLSLFDWPAPTYCPETSAAAKGPNTSITNGPPAAETRQPRPRIPPASPNSLAASNKHLQYTDPRVDTNRLLRRLSHAPSKSRSALPSRRAWASEQPFLGPSRPGPPHAACRLGSCVPRGPSPAEPQGKTATAMGPIINLPEWRLTPTQPTKSVCLSRTSANRLPCSRGWNAVTPFSPG